MRNMQYFITFLEGIITFISPCLLPMLPIYLSYLAGGGKDGRKRSILKNSLGFILGFTITFVVLGAFAGSIGVLLRRYQTGVNLVSGLIVILFGLNYLDLIHLNIFKGSHARHSQTSEMGFFRSILFGMIFSIGWTPCVGAFLGSALMLASQQASVVKGVLLLLLYSLGLGIPFFLSALLLEQLKSTFQWIKSHYLVINRVCGILLILVGVAMMTGWLGQLLSLLSLS